MTDIVERLTMYPFQSDTARGSASDLMLEAAAEIERLRRSLSLMQGHDTLAQYEAHIEEQKGEIERLRAGGCARDQRLTQYCAELMDAVRAEREACAMIALADDSFMMLQDFGMQQTCTTVRENIAAAIRARGDATDQPPSLPRQD